MSRSLWAYEAATKKVKEAEAALATAESNLIKARRIANDAWLEHRSEMESRNGYALTSHKDTSHE